MATNQASIRAVITAEDKASKVLANFGKNVDDTSKDVTSSISASTIAIGAATAGIVAFGKKSLDAWNAQDLATTRLQTGINNVKSATDKHIDSLIAQATALQKTTRFSDEAYISAQGILSTFQLNQKAISALTPRLADMSEGLARVTGEMPDLEGNAILVAKAIGGEDVTGLTGALRRAGVVMTDAQTQLLKTGTVEERVAVVTKVLDQNFQNMATGAGATTAGKIAELKNQFNDLEEKVGKLIADAITPLLNLLLQHPAVLTSVTVAVGLLTVAFVGLKVAAAISAVIDGVTVSLGAMTGAATVAASTLVGLSAVSMAVWSAGAVVAIGAVIYYLNTLIDTTKKATNAQIASNDSQNRLFKDQAQRIANDPTKDAGIRARAQAQVNDLAKQGYASGTDFAPGGMALVGEKGPELVNLPRGSQVIPNNKVGGMGATINVTFNGVFTGNQMEFRKLAKQVFEAHADAMGMGTM